MHRRPQVPARVLRAAVFLPVTLDIQSVTAEMVNEALEKPQ